MKFHKSMRIHQKELENSEKLYIYIYIYVGIRAQNYILGLGPRPRTLGDPRTSKQ